MVVVWVEEAELPELPGKVGATVRGGTVKGWVVNGWPVLADWF